MALFKDNKKKKEAETENELPTLLFPFINDENFDEQVLGGKPTPEPEIKMPKSEGFKINTLPSGVSPLQSVMNSVKQNVEEIKESTPDTAPQKEEIKPAFIFETESQKEEPKPAIEEVKHVIPTDTKAEEPKPAVKKSNLLAKCMPYIYEDDGTIYEEEGPDYALESVEDIIEKAERKANEKIARMYSLKTEDTSAEDKPAPRKETVKLKTAESSAGIKIGDETLPTSLADTPSIPLVASTLFDDFSARRTSIEGDEKVSTTYTELTDTAPVPDMEATRPMPDLKATSNTSEIYEDILSHTRTVDTEDIPHYSHKSDIDYMPEDEEAVLPFPEYNGKTDIKRVAGELNFNMLSARLRLIATAILALLSGLMLIPAVSSLLSENALVGGICGLSVLGLGLLVNVNIFSSFKTAFTNKSKIELPLAFSAVFMLFYLIFEVISGSYVFEPVVLPLISLVIYDYCAYSKYRAVFLNFKLIASKGDKKAIALIHDTATTSAMARSVIEGEILAAGSLKTELVEDFVKHSYNDKPFAGRIKVFTVSSLIASLIVSIVVGISHTSFSDAFCAFASLLCLSAGPSLFVADMLPFASLSKRLFGLRAGVCSKASAESIELLNAVVVSSSDIFPDGTIKLYSMSPLGANNLDETIALATAVTKEAKSPLTSLFTGMLSLGEELKTADSVKYEDNLGISGWVGDSHVMIGNRSIMQAHGVRVPALDVDRKILHKGYFPVYVAVDQRACALLTVKYTVSREVEYELVRLADKGVTILVDNCDPNITEEMLCDYFSLYPEIVKILDHHGSYKYRQATEDTPSYSAHGFYRGNSLGFVSLLNGCIRLRLITNILSALHIVFAVMGWLLYTGMSISSGMTLVSAIVCAGISLASLFISLLVYIFGKP